MKTNSIGIVGNGFVGSALYENFKTKYSTKVYDLKKEKRHNSLEDVLKCEIVFVCLPTPMRDAGGAECNLDIVNNFFANIPKNCPALFAIKSTVPVGTTKELSKKREDLKIVHNPEFLTANNAKQDFENTYRNVIGGSIENCLVLEGLLKDMFPHAVNIKVSSEESEMIKYFANTFLATKVSYFNLIYDFCEKIGADYENVIKGVCSDERIGFSHSSTPGFDGDRGFGGTCFPKDINSLIDSFQKLGLESSILEEVWNYNKKIRKNWDWALNKSAVLKD